MIDVTCLINNVVVTNKIDKLTVTDASKYIGLKNVVAYDIRRRRNDGRYVVRISLVRRRLNTISIFKPCVGNSKAINYFFLKIYARVHKSPHKFMLTSYMKYFAKFLAILLHNTSFFHFYFIFHTS